MSLALIDQAVASGARLDRACDILGLSTRSVLRWRDEVDDLRAGPRHAPNHKLSDAERGRIIATSTSSEFRDVSPKQIVPRLADRGIYIASESSFYRVLHEKRLMTHREHSRPPTSRQAPTLVATKPNEIWSWDITYLRGPVRGAFFFLYMVQDVYSRKIIAAEVYEEESSELAATLCSLACDEQNIAPGQLRLHSDNGAPMRGSTMLATLQRLGIVPSFSRPRVSDDNPYIESLFRTLKFRPGYPREPFASLQKARRWVQEFLRWYNREHLHSGIRYLTPDNRHARRDLELLDKRKRVYEHARKRTPLRWSRSIRNWAPVGAVMLNASRLPSAPASHFSSLNTKNVDNNTPHLHSNANGDVCSSAHTSRSV